MRWSWILIGALLAVVGGAVVTGGTVAGAGERPLVDAGLDQTVTQDTIVLLDGGGTRDPDGTVVSYEWQIEAPNGNRVSPENASDPETRFRASSPGRYEVTLRATDDDGRTGTDTLYVTVESTEPPDVSIEGPERVLAGNTATYVADASAPDGSIERIEWTNGDTGTTSTRQIDSPAGTRTVAVTVTDDDGRSATASKTVTVIAPNRDPSVDIQGPTTVTQGSSATFRANAEDPDGTIERVRWENGQTAVTTTRTFSQPVGTRVPLEVTVTDNRGGSATASRTVTVVKPPSTTATVVPKGSPTIEIDGPREVEAGTSHQYRARTSHPNDEPLDVRWFGRDFVHRGATHEHRFQRPPGTTVRFTATAEDPSGDMATATAAVEIIAVPQVSIEGLPDECLRAGEERTLSAETKRADPDVDYEWSVDGDPVGSGETITHTFARTGTTSVTLEGTNEEGHTGTASGTVCVEADNEAPEIQSLSAVWFASTHEDPGVPAVEHDAFDTRVDSRFPLVEFSAAATDPDGGDVTYHWDFGDGSTGVTSADDGETTISHDYSPTHGKERSATEFTVTLTVEDEHGATTSESRTVLVRKLFGGTGSYELSADTETAQVGEPVEFTVRNELTAARHVEGELVYGDGNSKELKSNTDTAESIKKYRSSGKYTVQFWSGNDRTGQVGLDDEIEITVGEQSYTIYTYGVEEQVSKIAPDSPGDDWQREEIDHLERSTIETRSRTAEANSQDARQLERDGYQAVDQWTRQEQVGTKTQRAVSSPGSEWTREERNVDTIERQSGWNYRTFDSPQYGSEWSLIKTVRTSEQIRQTTTSTDRPRGSGWSRDGIEGQTRTGWEYEWVDYRWQVPSDGQIVDSYRTVVDTETEYVCVNKEYYRDFLGNWRSRCVEMERQVVDRTYEVRYQYRAPTYSTVWEWERTETIYDTEYEYRKPVYETVWRDRYQKPIYEQQSYVEYEKEVFTTTRHYEWTTTAVTERSGLEYPSDQDIEWVESQSYDCPNEGPLADSACA